MSHTAEPVKAFGASEVDSNFPDTKVAGDLKTLARYWNEALGSSAVFIVPL